MTGNEIASFSNTGYFYQFRNQPQREKNRKEKLREKKEKKNGGLRAFISPLAIFCYSGKKDKRSRHENGLNFHSSRRFLFLLAISDASYIRDKDDINYIETNSISDTGE